MQESKSLEIKRFLKQTVEMARLNIKLRYRSTVAGFIWVVLNPIMMYSVQTVIFRHILKIEVRDYALFLLTGLLPWIFIVQSLDMSTSLMVTRANILKSFKMNPFILIVAQVLDNMVNFVTAFVLLVFVGYFFDWNYSDKMIYAPLCFIILFIGGCLLSCILSFLNVFFRDTKYVVSFVLNLLFFMTPIFYPKSLVPVEFRWMVDINPLYTFIEPLRRVLYPGTPLGEIFFLLGKACFFLVGFYFLFLFLWRRKKNELYSKL